MVVILCVQRPRYLDIIPQVHSNSTPFSPQSKFFPLHLFKWESVEEANQIQSMTKCLESYVTPIPEALDSADAAPMLCAGVTTYSALRRANAKPGQWVVISGAGGGLGHIACQLASRGMGLRVIGIDAGSKEKLVKDCGAEVFIDITKYDDASLAKEVKGLTAGLGASAVIVCTASNKAYAQSIDLIRFRGTVVCVGMPEGTPQPIAGAWPQQLVFKEANIAAIAVGNRQDAIDILDFAARGIVKSHFRTEKMEKLTDVFQDIKDAKLMGRVVIDLD